MTDIIFAPWTDEQVELLLTWQTCGYFHPYTCGICRDNPDLPSGEYALHPTKEGWICHTCNYRQFFCHRLMLDKESVESIIAYYKKVFKSHPDFKE